MRKFYTQLFLVVLMVTLSVTSGYAQGPVLWPEDNSTRDLLPTEVPGDQTLTITFAGDAPGNTVKGLVDDGIIALNFVESVDVGTGTAQQISLQIGEDLFGNEIEVNGNTISITFQQFPDGTDFYFEEDNFYYVTVSNDAIRFMDDTEFGGFGFTLADMPDFDLAADWGFKVKDVTPPQMVTCESMTIHNGERNVGLEENVVYICFDEPVYWVGGSAPDLNAGDIAFYHATNPDVNSPVTTAPEGDPHGEFGGDVLYAVPNAVAFSGDLPGGSTGGDEVTNGVEGPAWPGGEELQVWVKFNELSKYAKIGADSVWPQDADIYMRFLSGLIEDKDGNIWTGTNGSPWDPYTVDENKFWFTTRDDALIDVDIWNIVDDGDYDEDGETPLWDNEDFIIQIDEENLNWIADGTSLVGGANDVADLLEVEINGVAVDFVVEDAWEDSGSPVTYIHINPESPYSSGDVITVRVLGGLLEDPDLVVVQEYEESFTAGDFDPPVFDASINNILCTNFDLRTSNADEAGQVWYAMVDEDYLDSLVNEAGWDADILTDLNGLVTIEDIYNGYVMVDANGVASDGREEELYFNHIADPDAATAVYGNDHSVATGTPFVADSFNINPAIWPVTFEHIDDFVAQNHGKTFRLFYFGFDQDADGPFATGFETWKEGRATGVSMFEVELTDCLPPEHAWFFEGVNTLEDPLYDACSEGENIKRQGKWNFKVPNGDFVDELFFVDPSLSWEDEEGLIASDVFVLEVSQTVSPTSWEQVEIESIVYEDDEVIITPLNSYPSAGLARITLQSGSIMDESGNAINQELSCTKQVESYCDPYIETFTVDTKDLMFPGDPNHAGLNGVVALVDGTITVEFNNPMFIPKVDEDNSPVLEEIGEQDDVNNNHTIEEYIRIREGDEEGTDDLDVVDTENFTYVVTRAANGGVTKVEITPTGGYEFASETWYYVDVEEMLQDENRRELAWDDGDDIWHNNTFVDPHEEYDPYGTDDVCETLPDPDEGNYSHYFMRFRTEDTVAPQLMFTFNKEEPEPPIGPGSPDYPYVAEVDEDLVSCVTYNGPEVTTVHGEIHNGIPIGVIITEWSELGFDLGTDYYVEEDPNGLRDYFTLTNMETGETVDFDIVVLELAEPDEGVIYEYAGDYNDFVWFGFRPFVPLEQGVQYSMEFDAEYQAPGSGLDPDAVFIDDNGNELEEDTYVEFYTCADDPTVCIPVETSIEDDEVIEGVTPDITLTFDRLVDDVELFNCNVTGGFATIESEDETLSWTLADAELFYFENGTMSVEIPWEAWLSDECSAGNWDSIALRPETEYTLTINPGQFVDRNNESLGNCELEITFFTEDITPPVVECLSPDIEYNVLCDGSDSDGTYDLATEIDPRNPGMLEICFDEGELVDGKNVEIWERINNNNTLRWEFESEDGNWNPVTSTWTVQIPVDELNFESFYFVDVEAGFVVDEAGNEFPGINFDEDGTSDCTTWTFETGVDTDIEVLAIGPNGTIDPFSAGYEVDETGTMVTVDQLTITLNEGGEPQEGYNFVVANPANTATILQVPVEDFESTDGINWTYDVPEGDLDVEYGEIYPIWVEADAFLPSWGENTDGSNYYEDDFRFLDNVAPTARIWPVTDDEHVAFNTHGYVRFSESLVARDGSDELVVTQQNLRSWIKVYDEVNDEYLDPDEYVCEFIDEARQHVRVTFLDEDAPAIAGSTANLIDEWTYTIEVNITGDGVGDTGPVSSSGYDLEDAAGNTLAADYSETFDTEDLTEPEFMVTACPDGADAVTLTFSPTANVDPHLPTVRTYPAEAGTVYFTVLPADATPPTAAQLFNKTLANVVELDIPSGGDTYTWDLPASDVPPVGGYNFVVYAVMEDDEIDVFVPADYGNPWIADYPVFANFADYPLGIEDIREAPNQNMDVKSFEFCACDDDDPEVVWKEWHENRDVPVDETFEIKFDELIEFGPDVNTDGQGTGGLFPVNPQHEYGFEVRLRQWDNNVAVPIAIEYIDSSMIITPVDAWGSTTPADLEEETRYYIEIDRWVIRDIEGSNCVTSTTDDPAQDCYGCDDYDNYFDGWVGRDHWEFNTHDATPPELIAVAPQGCCVENENNPGELVFTFKEKNQMVLNQLAFPSNNIYIYKWDDPTIPFEVIPVSSASEWTQDGDEWTISFPMNHDFNSEEWYAVEWNEGIFTDNAAPVPHDYTIATSLIPMDAADDEPSCEYSEGVYDDGGDAGAPWDMFRFQSRDNIIPSVNWAMVSTLWQEYDHDYVYQVEGATGTWDVNDPDPTVQYPVTINECGTDVVPHKVAFYVWMSEDVQYTDLFDLEDAFYLEVWDEVSGWEAISINVVHNGEGPETLIADPEDFDAEYDWWVIEPVGGELTGSTKYRFGIVSDTLEDVSEFDCTPNNKIPGQELFNFCTWNTDPAVATLNDNCSTDTIPQAPYDADNLMDTCVCEDYVDLCFDKMVVKTAIDGADYPVGYPGAPWFSYANLLMTEEDLQDTDNGHYIDFREVGGDAVTISHVEIFVDGQNVDSGEPCFCGEGKLCYRLYVDGGLDENTMYTLTVQDSVLKDQTRVPNGNLFPGASWTFETRWNTAPYITDELSTPALTPADNAVNVVNNQPLVMTFNRDVIGGEGHIIVRDNANPQGVVINVPGTDPSVSISGNVVTVTHDWFADNTMYYVEIQDNFVYGAECDQIGFVGEIEQGIVDDEWNFMTGDVDGPIATLWPNQNPDDYTADCVAPVTNLELTFDENVVFDGECGELVIYRAQVTDPVTGRPAGSSTGGAVYGDVVERIDFTEDNFPQIQVSGTDPANGLTDNKITVIPTTEFVSGETYYVRIEGNGVDCDTEENILSDALGNEWYYPVDSPLPAIHYNDWWFTIDDDTAPMLVSVYPEREEELTAPQDGTGVTTDLVMEFDMPVWAGEGMIQIVEFIKNPEGGVSNQQRYVWKEIDVADAVASGEIVVEGNLVTIKDVWLLDGINWYYVLAESGTFTNTVPCILKHWEGISNPDTWLFSTEADVTCPALVDELVDSDAMDEMYEDPSTVNFTLTFSENICLLNGTRVAQILDSEGELVAEATLTPDHITDNVLSLHIDDFDAPLIDTSMYTLFIDSVAMHDFATNSVYGMYFDDGDLFGNVPQGNENFLCEDVMIDFYTGDFTPPTVVDFMPTENCLDNEVMIWAEFSEPVQDGDASLRLVDADGVLDDVVLDAADDEDAVAETVTFTVELPDSTNWYVVVEEGFVTDMVYMSAEDGPYANVALDDPATWTFGIDDNTEPVLLSWETPEQDIANLDTTFTIVLTYDDIITAVDETMAHLTASGNAVTATLTAETTDPVSNQVMVHISGVADQTEYMLELAEGFAWDDACGDANVSLDDEAGPFTVGDRTAPVLTDWEPTGILPSYIGVEVMVDFFDDSELTVDSAFLIISADEDTISWTPDLMNEDQSASTMPALWFGTYTVVIPEGAVVDANGNEFEGVEWSFSIVDNTPPDEDCLTIISPEDGDNCVGSDIVLEMEFCERMAAGDPEKLVRVFDMLEVQGQLQMNELFYTTAVVDSMINGEYVSIPVMGLEDNTSYIVMIDEGAMTDEAGNDFVGIDDPITWNFTTGDNTAPTVTLVPAEDDNQPNSIVIEAVFSEEVEGVVDGITVDNATDYEVTATTDPLVYEIAIEAADMDTVTVTVHQTITDVNCNFNPLAEEAVGTYLIGDNTPPTFEVTAAPEEPMNTENTFMVELTFSEVVTGVEAGLEGSVGLDTVVTADGMVYTLTFSGEDEAEGVLELIADSVTDVSENMNVLETGLVWDYMIGDWVDPTATVEPMEGEDLMVDTLNVTVTFSEEVIGIDSGLVVTGGEATITNEGLVYNVAITAEDGAEVTLELNSNITDDSYNANELAEASYTYTFGDRTAPTVTVEPESDDNADSTFDVVIVFSEQVTGIEEGITVMGESATIELSTIVEGMAYKATLSGAEKDTVMLGFTDAIQDLAGNALVPVEYTYVIGDFTAPMLTADPEEGTFVSNEFEVTLTFDEEVTGVEDAVTVSDGEVVVTGSGMVYTAVVTAPSMSDVSLMVGNTVADLAGNTFAGATYDYSVTGLVAIATVQGEDDESAHVGTTLMVEGTVTAVASGEGFFMQDGTEAWSGIWVEYADADSLEIGDDVLVVGEVVEVASVTSIDATEVTMSEMKDGHLIAPIVVDSPSALENEMYESMLVQVQGARATEANDVGEWTIHYLINDDAVVNDWLYAYTPVAEHYYDVTGIVNGRLDAYKLEPRMEEDIVDLTLTNVEPVPTVEFKVYPNPFSDHIKIDNNDKLTRVVISNIAGQRIMDVEYPSHEIRTANLVSGVYLVSLFTEDGLAKTERIVKR